MGKRILVLGDVNIDLVFSGLAHLPRSEEDIAAQSLESLVGGQGATTSRGLSRLGFSTSIVARVGQDENGKRVIRELQADGVDTTGVLIDPKVPTGVTAILSTGKTRAFATHLGAIPGISKEDLSPNLLENTDHVHISSFYMHVELRATIPRILSEAQDRGITTSIDPGWDPSEEWQADMLRALEHTDVFLPNEREAMTVTAKPTVAEAMDSLANSVGILVVKRGCRGALLRRGSMALECPSYAVDPIDVTSAGDVFDAGFLYGYLHDWDMARTLVFANACGALATSRFGSLGLMKDTVEVEEFIESHPLIPPCGPSSKETTK